MGPDASQQLGRAKRLDQVIVGTGIECGHLVDFGRAGGKNDDGNVRPGPQVADQVDAIAIRQAEVEHDQVRLPGADLDQTTSHRIGLENRQLLRFQGQFDEATNLGFILDNDHGGCGVRHLKSLLALQALADCPWAR